VYRLYRLEYHDLFPLGCLTSAHYLCLYFGPSRRDTYRQWVNGQISKACSKLKASWGPFQRPLVFGNGAGTPVMADLSQPKKSCSNDFPRYCTLWEGNAAEFPVKVAFPWFRQHLTCQGGNLVTYGVNQINEILKTVVWTRWTPPEYDRESLDIWDCHARGCI